jgi:hypothetical protein
MDLHDPEEVIHVLSETLGIPRFHLAIFAVILPILVNEFFDPWIFVFICLAHLGSLSILSAAASRYAAISRSIELPGRFI